MYDVYAWIAFFGAPLLLLLVTAFVFRPSAREHYRAVKHAILADDGAQRRRRARGARSDKRSVGQAD